MEENAQNQVSFTRDENLLSNFFYKFTSFFSKKTTLSLLVIILVIGIGATVIATQNSTEIRQHAATIINTPHSIGEQKTAIILFKFAAQQFDANYTDPETIIAPQYLNEMFFTDPNSLDAYIRESSYGKTWLAPFGSGSAIFGWYTLVNTAPTGNSSLFMPELDEKILSQDPTVKLSDYRRIVYIFPQKDTGLTVNAGTPGLVNSFDALGYHFPYGDFDTSSFIWLDAFWFGSKYFGPGAIRHEFIHSFTPNGPYPNDVHTNHEDALKCTDNLLPVPLPADLDPSKCRMTGPGIGSHYGEVSKERFSWFNPGNVVEIASSGRYTIEPYATTSNNVKVLKILRDPSLDAGLNVDYYITYRYPVGLDQSPGIEDYLLNTAFYQKWKDFPTQGVVIRNNYRTGNAVSHGIDVTPGSQADDPANPWDDGDDLRDAVLRPGSSFTIPIRNITVTTVSVDASGATVYITIPTITPTPTITPGATPTGTPTPTPTPTGTAGGTRLALTVGLHAIGSVGDNASSDASAANRSPQHTTRAVTVEIYNSQNSLVTTKNGTVTYVSSSGLFTGTVDLGSIASGGYTAKVKSDGYLRRKVPGIVTLTVGQTYQAPRIDLVVGDLNNDNALDILDYNILKACINNNSSVCTANYRTLSDLNDNGVIDLIDYNLFLRELSVQNGE